MDKNVRVNQSTPSFHQLWNDGDSRINGKKKTRRATSACEYKISHLYITFTKIHFILKIFSVQLQCIPCDTQKKKSYCIVANKENVPLITTTVQKHTINVVRFEGVHE